MTTHPGQIDQQRHKRQTRILIGIIGGIIGLVTLGAAVSAVGPDGAAPSDSGDEYGARDVCEQFVEDRLVSPSSADFVDTSARHLQGSSSEWLVTGSVDAENRMGASIRISYRCQVDYEGGDNWRLIDLETSER